VSSIGLPLLSVASEDSEGVSLRKSNGSDSGLFSPPSTSSDDVTVAREVSGDVDESVVESTSELLEDKLVGVHAGPSRTY
jgi:hypothetical protein